MDKYNCSIINYEIQVKVQKNLVDFYVTFSLKNSKKCLQKRINKIKYNKRIVFIWEVVF